MEQSARHILFYDGNCGFCNRSVSFVLKRDEQAVIHFASLQSSFTKAFFEEHNQPAPDLSTLYFWEDGTFYIKSAAAFRVIRYFPWYYQPIQIFWIVPRFLRDWVYDQIAKRRTRISKGYCAVPTQEEMKLFLDQSST